MKRIGLLSDTHSFIPSSSASFFKHCDEIWHAGDIGSLDVIEGLRSIAPVRAVHGNIDGISVRMEFGETLLFECENIKVMMTHIGGRPPKYNPKIRNILQLEKPALFVCGHSHILRVQYDEHYSLMYMNPGAAGYSGFHKKATMLRFEIDGHRLENLDVWELERSRLTKEK